MDCGDAPALDPAEVTTLGMSGPAGFIGRREVEALQRDGWEFSERGVQVCDGWVVWSYRNGEWRLRWLACPDRFPNLWT
jgi:hypothetical protein